MIRMLLLLIALLGAIASAQADDAISGKRLSQAASLRHTECDLEVDGRSCYMDV
jgi:hypothetical protein